MHFNLPNLLTIFRIGLIPFLVLFFYLPVIWGHTAAALIFAVAAVTDWLDGYLARRMQETSAFGAFLDPVADKLMVAAALVVLVDANPTPLPGVVISVAAVVIIGREIAISALREWMAEIGEHAAVAVNYIGKIKTTIQMIALVLLLYREPVAGLPTATVGLVLLVIAAGLTLWSMMIYIRAAWPFLGRHTG